MAFAYDPTHEPVELDPHPQDVMFAMGARVPFSQGEDVFAQGEAADFIYQLVSGVVRLTYANRAGRHHLDDVSEPGDLFGLDPGAEHLMGAEALSDCVVLVVSRRGLAVVVGEATLEALIAPELDDELNERPRLH